MELNFLGIVTNLDGSPVIENGNPIELSKALANNLANSTEKDPIKFYDWAMKLYKTGVLDLDRSDFELLKKFISEMPFSVLFRAQLLERFILDPGKSNL